MKDAPDPAAERLAVLEEWRRRQAAWKPKDMHSTGCLMLLVGVALFIQVPRIAGSSLGPILKGVIAVACIVLAVGGFIVMQIRRLPYDPMQLIEESVETLKRADADIESRRRAAVVLLFHYLDIRGPTERTNFSAEEMRRRLGPALAYVMSVDAILQDEIQKAPVFRAPQEPV